jgi:hypothetical protein
MVCFCSYKLCLKDRSWSSFLLHYLLALTAIVWFSLQCVWIPSANLIILFPVRPFLILLYYLATHHNVIIRLFLIFCHAFRQSTLIMFTYDWLGALFSISMNHDACLLVCILKLYQIICLISYIITTKHSVMMHGGLDLYNFYWKCREIILPQIN